MLKATCKSLTGIEITAISIMRSKRLTTCRWIKIGCVTTEAGKFGAASPQNRTTTTTTISAVTVKLNHCSLKKNVKRPAKEN